MGLTVITVSNVPASLRGDLTKWMQEIATGVYVGNLSARVRDELWKRVTESSGKGQATISYATNNELGYQFATHRTKQVNVSFDGIPLVMIPQDESLHGSKLKAGFSDQAKFQHSKRYSTKSKEKLLENNKQAASYIVLDIETDGLDPIQNNIIEVAALRVVGGNIDAEFHCLIKTESELPTAIKKLTGITDNMLAREGRVLSEVLNDLISFISDLPIVGYNIHFDMDFINEKLQDINRPAIKNRKIDLLGIVKKEKMFLKSYKFEDVLLAYGINESVPHRALQDARLMMVLSTKVNGFPLS